MVSAIAISFALSPAACAASARFAERLELGLDGFWMFFIMHALMLDAAADIWGSTAGAVWVWERAPAPASLPGPEAGR